MSTTAAKQAGGNEKVDGGTVVNGVLQHQTVLLLMF